MPRRGRFLWMLREQIMEAFGVTGKMIIRRGNPLREQSKAVEVAVF